MTEPVATYGNLRFWDNFGEYGFATKLRVEGLRNLGGVLSPFNAFLILQGMETLPLRMDAHVANAQTRRRVAGRRPARELGPLRRAARTTPTTRSRRSTCRRARARCSPSAARAGARRARRSSARVELCSHLANVGDTRTLVIHPGSTTHRQLSDRGAARPRACCPSWCASASASRTSTTSSSTSIGRSDEPIDAGSRRARPSAARSCAARRRSPSSARRPTRRARATSCSPTCCPRAPTTRSGRSRPTRTRSSARRPTRRSPTCRASRTSSTSSAAPTSCPGVAQEAVEAGAGAFWMQLGLHSDEAVRDRARGRPRRRLQPLREDRARALPRRPAPRGLRHRRHLLAGARVAETLDPRRTA